MTQVEIQPDPPPTDTYIDIRDLGVGGVPYVCVTVCAANGGPLVTGAGDSLVEALDALNLIVKSLPHGKQARLPANVREGTLIVTESEGV